jgi:hypothetical protein
MSFLSRLFRKRYTETSLKTTSEIRKGIASREARGKPCGVAYGIIADRSDAEARKFNIDPPRPGRKTYAERYAASPSTISGIKAEIAIREAQGKPCGVLYRKLSDMS